MVSPILGMRTLDHSEGHKSSILVEPRFNPTSEEMFHGTHS